MVGKAVISDDEDDVGVEEEERDEEPEGERIEHGDDDDEDEDDEEGQDEYEDDGFIVSDVEEEEQEEEEEEGREDAGERQKKKKRKKRDSERSFVLDEDDYELLQESNISVPRPKESKKFKRLKKAQGVSTEEHSGFSDEEDFTGTGKRGRTAEEKVKLSLFDGDDEGQPLEDIPEEQTADDDVSGYEDDDMSNFIVSEEEDENGGLVRKRVNKKKPRQSTHALSEAIEIFGDVDEYLSLRHMSLSNNARNEDSADWKETGFEKEFEPIILSEKYMTKKDDQIRAKDIPERMQVSEESTGAPSSEGIEVESSWIFNQLPHGLLPLPNIRKGTVSDEHGNEALVTDDTERVVEEYKRDIMRFLELTHVQKFDVPFIAMYRKEDCPSLLKDPAQHAENSDQNNSDGKPTLRWHKVLWAIQDLDKKWLLLQKRKTALESYYNRRYEEESRRVYHVTRLNLNQKLFESIADALKAAESEREVDDVDLKFNLHFPPGEVGVDEGRYKRPKRKSLYSTCSKAGLWEVSSKFGYSSEQFGLQISLENMRVEELEDPKETPEEMASNFTCAMFDTPQAVLKGARHMAAVEICCEPSVRKHVRGMFMDNATVSTTPTAEGNTAIDSFHQFAGVKWLKNKPLTKFEDAQWLLIQKAEEEKLLQVKIKLPEAILDKLIGDANDYYCSQSVSRSANLWNEQRKQIIEDAFFNFLLPSMEKEARSYLTSKAKSWLHMEYGRHLWDRVSVAPYQRKESDSSDDEVAPRVMACCWGPGKPATTFVMLDSSGEVQDVLFAGSLSLRGQSVNDQQRKKNDQQRVLKFMMDHQPHVVVLGAVNLSCTRLKEDIYEIIFKMVEENPREVGHELDNLNIVYGDESLPHLYENSRVSADQLPGQSGIVRRAVALGRYIQNPLAMVATLCGPGREILTWKLSPLDSYLTPDEKYAMVEQVMVDVTNQVGLDLNLAASHEWLFAPLQFISGLGPRKAAFLQRSLVRAGAIFTRKDLLTAHGLGKKVFVNAVGFLRVRRSGNATGNGNFIDLLDDTRIHPESYGLAQELAKDVYIMDVGDETNTEEEETLEMAIEHVRYKPHLLRGVNAYEYAVDKHRQGKKETLNDIRLELMHGFQDWRRPYQEPSQDEEFYMISGETEETLSEGRIVQATVRRVQPQRATCVLDSGLTGMLAKEDYTDDWRGIDDLSEKLHEGDILTCRVKSIQKNRYQVFLSCKESDLRNNRHQNYREMDPYYHEDRSILRTQQEKVRKEELAKKHFKPRLIVHPRFRNITADEAMEFLSDKDPGESIVRPSSRGPSYLTLTLKIYDGVYAHKDIIEGGKEHKDITSLLRIGKTLKIGEDIFEDLDEVMDRYVDPLVTHLKAMLNYRKFRKGTKAEVDDLLRAEKAENPMRIVYSFGIFHEHPGTFILTYIRSSNPHHEYIGLYPKGFKFRKRMFEDLDRLVAYFQRHIDDPLDSAPSIRSVAAMVPMRSPAAGGTSGFGGNWGGSSNEGGWKGSQSVDRGGVSFPDLTSGRNDYRNGSSQEGHPSGMPRPYGGRGRGRGPGRGRGSGSYVGGRGNYNRQDEDCGSEKWGSKDGEAFAGGWGVGGNGTGGGWGGNTSTDGGSSGWGGGNASNDGGGSGWGTTDGGRSGGEGSSSGWGAGASGNGGGRGSGTGGWGNDSGNSGWGNSKQSQSGGGW
ncbi:OLC1v1036228C1 [Oldenlandia corymbosa var. corymbosa]|uniref:Transcription elongation factor spt6 n=1 Tax=Oldenlandia corymbosa var. corymbosa TaxID=529605 RepID=A0AAV1CW19_OLDCO|nr:OLC1v1036228C1 [Oldenlandia corymbosa var. corymbosa]